IPGIRCSSDSCVRPSSLCPEPPVTGVTPLLRSRHSIITAGKLYHVPDGTTAGTGAGRAAVGSVASRRELSSAPWCVVPGGGFDVRRSEARRQPGADPCAAHVPEDRYSTAPALDDRRPPAGCEKPARAMGRQIRRVPRLPQPHGAEGAPHTMRCARCECTFRVGWEEWFVGVG